MKKITLFIVAVAALSFTACKKDRTCTCTVTSNAPSTPGYSQTTTQENTMTKVSKGSAKAGCVSREETPQGGTGPSYTTTYDCKLK